MKLIFMILLLAGVTTVKGQQHRPWEYHWIFGNGAHVIFNDTGIAHIDSIFFHRPSNGGSNYNDSAGNLLYYVTADTIDAFGKGSKFSIHGPTGQLLDSINYLYYMPYALNIVKFKGNDTLYNYTVANTHDTTRYIGSNLICIKTLVDTAKNVRLCGYKQIYKFHYSDFDNPVMIKHANGIYWWLIFADPVFTNKFYKFLITPKGVLGSVIIITGIDTIPNFTYDDAPITCSLSGNYIARMGNRVIIYNFDRCTGDLTYSYVAGKPFRYYPDTSFYNNKIPQYKKETLWSYYGAAFSPDDKYLYFTNPFNLYRAETNPLDTTKAVKMVFTNTFSHPAFPEVLMLGMSLGPDNRMYIAESPIFFTIPNSLVNNPKTKYLHRVRPINNNWDSVAVDTNYVYLGSKNNYWLLPQYANYALDSLPGATGCDTLNGTVPTQVLSIAIPKGLSVYPNPAKDMMYIDSPIAEYSNVELYDILGDRVFSSKIAKGVNALDISSLSDGIYIVHIYSHNNVYVQKLVLSK